MDIEAAAAASSSSSSSSSPQTAASYNAAASSSTTAQNHEYDPDVPSIFLSHSGKQKPFVERLYERLVHMNHFPFFDRHSLAKGEPFPDNIKKAARGCKLGVVVLSQDFVSSKWPMLELQIMLDSRRRILPLFYHLSLQDLKSQENLSMWREAWARLASTDKTINIATWEQALERVDKLNGEVFAKGTSEANYIGQIIRSICKIVPSHVLYDLSHVKGQQQIIKEIDERFNLSKNVCGSLPESATIIGLHAVGGFGKTTMCKIMANHYQFDYSSKCTVLELPLDGNTDQVMQGCKMVLRKVQNLNEHLLRKVDDFDQVVGLMKDHMRRCDVFMAIDNVSENSKEKVKRILEVGFGRSSKILLTSRSKQVLRDLLIRQSCCSLDNCKCLGSIPSMNEKVAIEILEESFGGDLSWVARDLFDRGMRCAHGNIYHPLALKAVGSRLNRVQCDPRRMNDKMRKKIEDVMHDIVVRLEKFGILEESQIKGLIKENYIALPDQWQCMFLDIAATFLCTSFPRMYEGNYEEENVHRWLSSLYKGDHDGHNMIHQLALPGLLELETSEESESKKKVVVVKVHDLYLELAKDEIAQSPRFLVVTKCFHQLSFSTRVIEWEKLEIVILRDRGLDGHNLKLLQQRVAELQEPYCPKLRVLHIEVYEKLPLNGGLIRLERMPCLCVLQLNSSRGALQLGIEGWSAAADSLVIVELVSIGGCPGVKFGRIPNLPLLQSLHIWDVGPWEGGLPELQGCTQLTRLSIIGNLCWQINSPPSSLWNSIWKKKKKKKKKIKKTKKLPSSLWNSIWKCTQEEEEEEEEEEQLTSQEAGVPDDDYFSSQLQELEIMGFNGKMLPNFSALCQLQKLKISVCNYLEEMPSLHGCVHSLRRLKIFYCPLLKKLPGFMGLGHLEELSISSCATLQEIPSLHHLVNLQELDIANCTELLSFCNLHGPVNLRTLSVSSINGLRKFPDLESTYPNLKELTLSGCDALEEVGCLPPPLEELSIWKCPRLNRLPDLQGLVHLKTSHLMDLSIEIVDGTFNSGRSGEESVISLKKLYLYGCTFIGDDNTSWLASLTSVEEICLRFCNNIRCPTLADSLTNLKYVGLYDCESLEEIVGDLSAHTNVSVSGCPRLKIFPPCVQVK